MHERVHARTHSHRGVLGEHLPPGAVPVAGLCMGQWWRRVFASASMHVCIANAANGPHHRDTASSEGWHAMLKPGTGTTSPSHCWRGHAQDATWWCGITQWVHRRGQLCFLARLAMSLKARSAASLDDASWPKAIM